MPYSTDTRTLRPGDTYVAIRGETHDGHAFLAQAIEKGATGLVVETDPSEHDVTVPEGVEVTRVEGSVAWLVDRAAKKVRRIDPDIVAITGSVGKTTTRTAVSAVVGEAFHVVASEGNKNTPLGIALRLLNASFESESKLVLEMGARLEGDIRELCTHFPPTVSVVTNVRGVHVETLGSIDGVQREKSELVRALDADGTACLNGDDPRVRQMAEVTRGRVVTYGTSPGCDVGPDRITVDLPILGDHAVVTALAAYSAGLALGMTDEAINRGLAQIKPEKGRLNRLAGRGGSTLIDDTYNASPEPTLAALRVLEGLEAERRIAFLGDMLELGETEIEEHARVLEAALATADEVYAVGSLMRRAAETLPEEKRTRIHLHDASRDLAASLRTGEVYVPREGDAILVKGSQGTRMERISEALLAPDLDAADVLPRQSESWKQIA